MGQGLEWSGNLSCLLSQGTPCTCQRNTPPEKKTRGMTSFHSTTIGGFMTGCTTPCSRFLRAHPAEWPRDIGLTHGRVPKVDRHFSCRRSSHAIDVPCPDRHPVFQPLARCAEAMASGFAPSKWHTATWCLISHLGTQATFWGTGSGFLWKSTGANRRKRFSTNTYRNTVLFLQKSPRITGNLRELTGSCNLGILYSSSLLDINHRSQSSLSPRRRDPRPFRLKARASRSRRGPGSLARAPNLTIEA